MPWYYRCRLNYARIGVAASYEALLAEYKDTLGRSDYPEQLRKRASNHVSGRARRDVSDQEFVQCDG